MRLMSKGRLSKKILYSLTTLPVLCGAMLGVSIAEAAPVHETQTVQNTTKVYEDGSSITVNDNYAVYADSDNTTDITIEAGELKISGDNVDGAVVANNGKINFGGDVVSIKNNNTEDWSSIVRTENGGILNLNNNKTVIQGEN